MCLLAFLRGNGTVFPRRRLQLFFLRRKRYFIPAQKSATEDSGRVRMPIPAQNGAMEDSGRIWHRFPAQAVAIFLSAQKKIPYFGAEWCHGAIRADFAAHSGAELHLRAICAC
jgi:hypothetical protein